MTDWWRIMWPRMRLIVAWWQIVAAATVVIAGYIFTEAGAEPPDHRYP